MNPDANLTPYLKPLTALQRLLDRFSGQGIIMGGIAASLLGTPRLTADLDAMLLLSVQDIPRLTEIAKEEGFTPRIKEADKFAKLHRVLLLEYQETGTPVDISLGVLPFENETVARSTLHQLGDISIRLPSPEDLIILKAVAHRPKDLIDIQAVIENHPNLDRKRIQRWVQEFALALEMPELWDDIADLLS
jgi:Nucleotidyl transferase AbiEii toxin, Type IV TA system